MSDTVTAIVPAVRTALSFDEVVRLGSFIAKSGLFGMRTPEQAIALMMIAHAEGSHPALAARDYDIINGKPTKKAEAMLRDFLNAGGKVKWHSLSDDIADATFSHPQGGEARIAWDMARAQKAQLKGKDMYARYPRQMLRSRCVAEGVRTIWPSATGGMYVPEEAVHIEPEQTPPPPPPDAPTGDADPLVGPKGGLKLKALLELLRAVATEDELHNIRARGVVHMTLNSERTPSLVKQNIIDAFKQAHDRLVPAVDEEPVPEWVNNKLAELIAEVQTMDLVRLNGLPTDAQWRARVREAVEIPPDEDELNDAITARKAELRS